MNAPRKDRNGRIYPVSKGPPEGGWPVIQAPPVITPRLVDRKALRRGDYADSPKSALEVLSRLAGSTTFKEPTNGRTTRGQAITNEDIAHALGHVHDPLIQRLALAVACQTAQEWPSIQLLAYPLLVKQLQGSHNTRSIVAGVKRYRVKLVLHEVFFDVVYVRKPKADYVAARLCKMSVRDYRALYKSVAGFLETSAQEGANIAKGVLYGA